MSAQILHIESTRAARQRRVQKLQHVFAAVVLISTGIGHGGASVLAIAEILAGAVLIATVVRERLRGGHHGGVAWVELAGAVMTLVEAFERTRGRHHLSFLILSFAMPVVFFLFAIFDARIAEAHYLKADDEGFTIRLRLLFRRRVKWSEVRSFRVAGEAIELEGARALSFRRIVDRERAIAWSAEQFRRHGVAESTG